MAADLVVRGGTVIDGTGAPGVEADVAIVDGKVAEIGSGLSGARELDASGQVVAPGFIDIHTHYDAQVFWDPALTPSCYHGVTTVVAGNCGFSIAPTREEHHSLVARTLENVEDMNVETLDAGIPWDFETFPEYLDSVRRRGLALNYTAYLGHTALRLYVMGDDGYSRKATDDEIAEMRRVLAEGLAAGAAGFATSCAMTHRGADGLPVPSRFASAEEIYELGDELGAANRGVFAMVPGEPLGITDLYDLQRRIGVPVTYGALLTSPSGHHNNLAALNDKERAEGAQVWPQVTPRPLTFQMSVAEPFTLNPNPVMAELMAQDSDARLAAYADAEWRQRAREGFENLRGMRPRWDTFQVAESPNHPEFAGRMLEDVAGELGMDAHDALFEIAVRDDLGTRVNAILANDDYEGRRFLLGQDNCTLGLSDAGAHVGQLCDAPQATDFLGNWVRDEQLMPIEKAVRKLTGVQADLFGFADRGYLKPGMAADVTVFDPDTVAPGPLRRVRDFPADAERLTADQPTGITHVVVNGTPIQTNGVLDADAVESRPGQLVAPSPRD